MMSTIEIFAKILAIVDSLKDRNDLGFKLSNSKDICEIEYNKEVYDFFYSYKDNKLRISIVEVNGGILSFFGDDLETLKFKNKLVSIYNSLSKVAKK